MEGRSFSRPAVIEKTEKRAKTYIPKKYFKRKVVVC